MTGKENMAGLPLPLDPLALTARSDNDDFYALSLEMSKNFSVKRSRVDI